MAVVRELKHHEKKLLRGVDFYRWDSDRTDIENALMVRFGVTKREELRSFCLLAGEIRSLVADLRLLPSEDGFRKRVSSELLKRLRFLGIVSLGKSLEEVYDLPVTKILARRLSYILKTSKMAPSIDKAVDYIEHGHICVGNHRITDPSILLPPHLADSVVWAKGSKIRAHIAAAKNDSGELDDFAELMC